MLDQRSSVRRFGWWHEADHLAFDRSRRNAERLDLCGPGSGTIYDDARSIG